MPIRCGKALNGAKRGSARSPRILTTIFYGIYL